MIKSLEENAFVAPTEEQYDLLLKRLKQQLGEGRGEVILELRMPLRILLNAVALSYEREVRNTWHHCATPDSSSVDQSGNVVNKPEHGSLDWVKICEKSSKVITFIDLAGQCERYLKTTVFDDRACTRLWNVNGWWVQRRYHRMRLKEHLGLALALGAVFVVVTKIDMCPANVLQDNLKMLVRILKSPGCRKRVPVMVKTSDDVVLSATNFVSERLCPIFQVSNVSDENLGSWYSSVRDYSEGRNQTQRCTHVGARSLWATSKSPLRVFTGRGWLSRKWAGQTASFALKKIKRSQIRKGMVMVSPALNPQACWEFEGRDKNTTSPDYYKLLYQAMGLSRDGDKALIHFRFIKHPEYMTPGQRMVFREGRTKAVGNVIRTITQTTPTHQNNHSKQNKQQRHWSGHHSQRNEKNVQQMFNNENTLQELSEMGNTSNDSPFEASPNATQRKNPA
ncbi:hypothetical protein NQ317_019092 [Molorchus minor]|uniref:Uncharacterized protein n=1 Tax=Molorchus minor TaxID=1323400 RepID=A0ABQ9JL91_9CUCU|nr:hypothetical protein NQ317_019092 [Molorchus minor]